MRVLTVSASAALAMFVLTSPVLAESCYDLWYERNAIYDANGYCFETQLGQETFDNSDCWTSNPKLSKSEQRRVDRIRREERRRGCKVNK